MSKASFLSRAARQAHTTNAEAHAADSARVVPVASEQTSGAVPLTHNFGRIAVGVQPQLLVNQPGDRYEQEAAAVAAAVVEGDISERQHNSNSSGVVQRSVAAPPSEVAPGSVHDTLTTAGQPLDGSVRGFMEQRFGHDFGSVRIHSDTPAAESARSISARAYTYGHNVVFGAGQYAPHTATGQHLLAHELTHVVQQGAAPAKTVGVERATSVQRSPHVVQRSFFGDLWSGIRSVGRTIGGAVRSAANWVGGAITTATGWVADRARDASMWVINLIRDLPARLARLAQTLWDGLSGVVTFIPEAIQALRSGGIRGFAGWLWEKAKRGGAWILTLVSRVFDVLGGPELVEFITHMVTRATPLTDAEKTAAKSVLGPSAIRYDEVRVAEGGLLSIIFHFNEGRAFATFHTINLPSTGEHGRSNLAIVVHELTHVYQYEKTGSLYLGQAIHAQATIGYGYGGGAGLIADHAAGKHYREYNREQQAQIAQDYYALRESGGVTTPYDPYIAELRAGDL